MADESNWTSPVDNETELADYSSNEGPSTVMSSGLPSTSSESETRSKSTGMVERQQFGTSPLVNSSTIIRNTEPPIIAVNARSVSGSPTAVTTGAVKSLRPAIPLAVALRESCNAVFHGADAEKCVFEGF